MPISPDQARRFYDRFGARQDASAPFEDRARDALVSLDLMPEADIRRVLAEAHRVLEPDGLLCLVSLTRGERPLSRLITAAWAGIARVAAEAVGGCRPIELREFVDAADWEVQVDRVVTSLAAAVSGFQDLRCGRPCSR